MKVNIKQEKKFLDLDLKIHVSKKPGISFCCQVCPFIRYQVLSTFYQADYRGKTNITYCTRLHRTKAKGY